MRPLGWAQSNRTAVLLKGEFGDRQHPGEHHVNGRVASASQGERLGTPPHPQGHHPCLHLRLGRQASRTERTYISGNSSSQKLFRCGKGQVWGGWMESGGGKRTSRGGGKCFNCLNRVWSFDCSWYWALTVTEVTVAVYLNCRALKSLRLSQKVMELSRCTAGAERNLLCD